MTVNRTTLLDLPLPVTGTESGTWGDTTNNGLTQYLDIAIAGTLVLSTDADVTLTSTEGDSSATNIGATTAQYAILRWTATGSTTRNITALAQSKTYVVINATGGTQSIVLRGAGPTTGVTIISGEKAHCVWNGSDFVKVSSSAAAGGSNTQVQYNSSGVLAGSSNMTFNGTTLSLTGLNNTGNTTLGDASADSLTVNATITSNLLFTDNTYDIGASGATRPRNLFLAGNATVGGNQTLTGSLTVDSTTDSSSTTTGSIQTDGGLGVAKALYVGTTANIAGNVTLSGGTANGVAYLNGSKVLTTGSALTFDTARLSFIKASNGRAWSADGDDLFAIENSTSANADFRTSTTGATYLMFSDTDARARGYVAYLHNSDNMPFAVAGAEAMRLTSTGLTVQQGAVFNESGADSDFRVESDTNTHMLFVDAGTDTVNIGGTPPTYPGKLNVGGGGIFSNATNFDPDLADNGTILLGNINDGGGFSAPGIGWKNSGTGNTAAVVAAGNTLYLGTGDASTANSLTARLNLSHLESVFNEGGLDVDFRVESDGNAHMLFVDAGNNQVFIGAASGNSSGTPLNVVRSGTAGTITKILSLYDNTFFPSGHPTLELVGWQGGGNTNRAYMSYEPGSRLVFYTAPSAVGDPTPLERAAFGNSETVFNEQSYDVDFRVESDTNTHALFVDAGNSRVGMGTSTPATTLEVAGNTTLSGDGVLNFNTTGSQGAAIIRNQSTQVSVSTSATAITGAFGAGAYGAFMLVFGDNGGNTFIDTIIAANSGTPTVLHSTTVSGSPAGRTYSTASNTVHLAMASGTYNVSAMIFRVV